MATLFNPVSLGQALVGSQWMNEMPDESTTVKKAGFTGWVGGVIISIGVCVYIHMSHSPNSLRGLILGNI